MYICCPDLENGISGREAIVYVQMRIYNIYEKGHALNMPRGGLVGCTLCVCPSVEIEI